MNHVSGCWETHMTLFLVDSIFSADKHMPTNHMARTVHVKEAKARRCPSSISLSTGQQLSTLVLTFPSPHSSPEDLTPQEQQFHIDYDATNSLVEQCDGRSPVMSPQRLKQKRPRNRPYMLTSTLWACDESLPCTCRRFCQICSWAAPLQGHFMHG